MCSAVSAIKTYDGRRVVIPNAALFTDSVTVNTAFNARRLECDVGIGYGDDIDRAKALILEAVTNVAGVLQEPPPEALVTRAVCNWMKGRYSLV
jgi:small conductance mechanosensitive channel